jgi:protein AroM
MTHKLGVVTIGQGPRPDMVALFTEQAPAGTEVTLVGCLDGLSRAEIDALPPRDDADALYSRLPDGSDVMISKQAVIERAPAAAARLKAQGVDAIVFACTGEFPAGMVDGPVVMPSRVLNGMVAGLLPQGRLGLLVPIRQQVEHLPKKRARPGLEVFADVLTPSAGVDEAVAAAERLKARKPDLVAMDCMSYRPEAKAAVRRVLGVPVLLAITTTGRAVREMLE